MRPLDPAEKALVDLLLSDETLDGVADLRVQAEHITTVESECGCGCPTITLYVDHDAALSVGSGYGAIAELLERTRDGQVPRLVILFTRDGYLSCLECVYFDDPRPEWPAATDCDLTY